MAPMLAEYDLTGSRSRTAKASGFMASRGLNAYLRNNYKAELESQGYTPTETCSLRTYYHPTNYFQTGAEGCDNLDTFFWDFPPSRSINTKVNILNADDEHEYPIRFNTTRALDLTVEVRAAAVDGIVNPEINLWDVSSDPYTELASVAPGTPTAVITYLDWPGGPRNYVIVVTGDNTAEARGYYDLKITLK